MGACDRACYYNNDSSPIVAISPTNNPVLYGVISKWELKGGRSPYYTNTKTIVFRDRFNVLKKRWRTKVVWLPTLQCCHGCNVTMKSGCAQIQFPKPTIKRCTRTRKQDNRSSSYSESCQIQQISQATKVNLISKSKIATCQLQSKQLHSLALPDRIHNIHLFIVSRAL